MNNLYNQFTAREKDLKNINVKLKTYFFLAASLSDHSWSIVESRLTMVYDSAYIQVTRRNISQYKMCFRVLDISDQIIM